MIKKLKSILESEGLLHLLSNFTDQGITDSILSDLSTDDLRDIGIDKLGDRKRLLASFGIERPRKESDVEEASATFTRQEDFTYEASHGSVTITGFNGKGHVRIPSKIDDLPVRAIAREAFKDNQSLLSVVIPEGVFEVGDNAFINCTSLTDVTIPNSANKLSCYNFHKCTNLMNVNISDSHLQFAFFDHIVYKKSPFEVLFSLESSLECRIADGATSIGDNAFANCKGLASVTIPDSVTSIGKGAFSGCEGLVSVTIPHSVTSIGEMAFIGCKSLVSVTIPNILKSIEKMAFSGCESLASVTIPNSVTSIGDHAFSHCKRLMSVTIPNSVTSISKSAFSGSSGASQALAEWEKRQTRGNENLRESNSRPFFMKWFS